MMRGIYLLLGSNIGQRRANLAQACELIDKQAGPVKMVSSIYETEPWGKSNQQHFLNQALQINTSLSPLKLLETIHRIESKLGRIRYQKWAERIIDVDILYYENKVIKSDLLTIPHPELHNRMFALVPLVEIAPLYNHPVLGKTSMELLHECTDVLGVKKLTDYIPLTSASG